MLKAIIMYVHSTPAPWIVIEFMYAINKSGEGDMSFPWSTESWKTSSLASKAVGYLFTCDVRIP
jgi:hypothetical protein